MWLSFGMTESLISADSINTRQDLQPPEVDY